MRFFCAVVFWAACLAAGLPAAAQVRIPARAQKAYTHALRAESRHQPARAEAHLRKALRLAPQYTAADATLGAWLESSHRYADCIALLRTATLRCPKGDSVFALPLARALMAGGQPAEAQKLIQKNTGSPAWQGLQQRAAFVQLLPAGVAQQADSVQPLPRWRINTAGAELAPSLSADGRSLLFTRRAPGGDEEIMLAAADTCGGWLAARPLPQPVNSPQPDCTPAISADRHYLFFSRSDMRSQNGWDGGGADLFMAYTADSVWSIPQSFGATINSPGYEASPCLSADNRVLFFASNRPGGYGGTDLWFSVFENSRWQAPHNLGPVINSPGNEDYPFLHPDGRTLYYTSTGHAGFGGADIFMALRTNDSVWSPPVNAGPGINTPAAESSPFVSTDGRRIFFASDRDSLAGNTDLYEALLPAALRPGAVAFVAGAVYDSVDGGRLNYAQIFFQDSMAGQPSYRVVSNRGDGSYCIALPQGHTFFRSISRTAYQEGADVVRTGAGAPWPPDTANVALLPYDYVRPQYDTLALVLHFDKNAVTLSAAEAALLRSHCAAWRGRPGARLLLNSYTDNTGTPMLNEALSAQRALAVAALLQAEGLTPESLSPQGFGEAEPVGDNDTEAGRAANRRVEIVIRN